MERRLEGSWFWRGISLICIAAMVGIGSVALAQAPVAPPPNPPNQAPSQPIPPQQLDNLVAPIALYPDPLLGQVLAASTYPLELVEAKQWVQANPTLQGQQLTDAARQQPWDASVQAMVAMPDVLNRLTEDIHWTTDLGNAFLAQQADVMGAVQRMRVRAQANGKLQSTPQETVTTENQGGQSAVEIQPADPQVIYVPTYDPNYIWGAPDWGYYPSLWYPSYGYWWGPGINIGLCFGGWGGWGGWGWGPNWFGHGIFVNGGFFSHYGYHYGYGFGRGGFGGRGFGGAGFRAGTTAWAHDPGHRLGVGYSNSQLNSRYGAASQASRAMQTRASAASGNWQRFSQAGNANSFRGSSAQAGARYQSPAQRSPMAGQRYQAPAQRYQSPAQRYQAPAQRYQAPAQRYQAPAQSFRSAPRMSAPSFGGGGARSFGGGGAARSFGGGGGGARSFGGSGGGARSFGGGGGGGFHGGGGGGHGGGGHR